MKVSPRKAEVTEIVKLLESDGYDSADALAKDVIKRCAELFAEREWYAYAWRGMGLSLAWGPLSSETEAKKFAQKTELEGQHAVVKLFSTGSLLSRLAEAESAEERGAFCVTCEHPLGAHEHPKMSGKCAVGGCSCTEARKK